VGRSGVERETNEWYKQGEGGASDLGFAVRKINL
jgi:hypothetical protein